MSLTSGCDRRVFHFDDNGISDEVGDSETDEAETDEAETDEADETETGGSTNCIASVQALTITDATDPVTVECVTKVVGDLTIGPSIELADLSMLSELREVGGTLYIAGNLGLTSLEGLEKLQHVDWLHIRRNGALVDLHGLDGLDAVSRISVINNDALIGLDGLPLGLSPSELDIAANDMLADLDGLPILTAPSSGSPLDIEIEDHEVLTSVAGLAACCSTQPVVIELARNAALVDLDGLEPFQRFDTLRLVDNRALADLSGVDATEIGNFELSYNHCASGPEPVLVDFAGLEQISSIDVMVIDWAASIESFTGLENMVDVTKMQVRNNAKLDWQKVVDLVGQTGPTLFDGCGGIGGPECPVETCPTF
ncbi:hypothetical protein ACNOYE_17825 [Nannocystaceae bacterium ST9]